MTDFSELKKLLAEATAGPWEAMIGTAVGSFVRAPGAVIANDRGPSYATQILSDEDYDTKDADAALIVALRNQAEALIARVEALEDALTFYASELNHIGHADPCAGVYLETSPVDTDGGERARAALKGAAQ